MQDFFHQQYHPNESRICGSQNCLAVFFSVFKQVLQGLVNDLARRHGGWSGGGSGFSSAFLNSCYLFLGTRCWNNCNRTCFWSSHSIHVWYVYLHFPSKSTIHVGKIYQPHGWYGNFTFSISRKWVVLVLWPSSTQRWTSEALRLSQRWCFFFGVAFSGQGWWGKKFTNWGEEDFQLSQSFSRDHYLIRQQKDHLSIRCDLFFG